MMSLASISFVIVSEIFFLSFVISLIGGIVTLFISPSEKKTKHTNKVTKKLFYSSFISLIVFFLLVGLLHPSNTEKNNSLLISLINIGLGIMIVISGINIILEAILLLFSLFTDKLKTYKKLFVALLIASILFVFITPLVLSFFGPHYCGLAC